MQNKIALCKDSEAGAASDSGSVDIHQNSSKSAKIVQNRPKSAKIGVSGALFVTKSFLAKNDAECDG